MRELTGRLALMIAWVAAAACVAQPGDATPQADPQTAPPPTVTAEVEAWLDRIEARAAALQTLRAKVRIAIVNVLTGDEQVRLGPLVYDAGPPARFSIHLNMLVIDGNRGEKMDTWYIFDGRWLLERNHDNRTAIRRQLVGPEEDAVGADPLGLGRGPFPLPLRAKKAQVLARFEVVLVEPSDRDPPETVHLKLTPRDATEAVRQIDLWYHRTTLLPVSIASLAEDETVVTLMDARTDEPVEEGVFDTALPQEQGWTTEVRPWEEKPQH